MAKKDTKEVPEGIKILSVLYFSGSAILVFFGAMFLNLFDGLRQGVAEVPAGFNFSPAVLLLLAFLFFALAIFEYFLAKGLWNLKNWARVVTAVFAVLGVVGSFSNLASGMYASGIFALAVSLLIGWYLLFNESVKKVFKK